MAFVAHSYFIEMPIVCLPHEVEVQACQLIRLHRVTIELGRASTAGTRSLIDQVLLEL